MTWASRAMPVRLSLKFPTGKAARMRSMPAVAVVAALVESSLWILQARL
jgi:hypothetical protein